MFNWEWKVKKEKLCVVGLKGFGGLRSINPEKLTSNGLFYTVWDQEG